MLLDRDGWSPAQASETVLAQLSDDVRDRMAAETQACVIELATVPHRTASAAGAESRALRQALRVLLDGLGLGAAGAGTHPTARWEEIEISDGSRYQDILRSMRELARREPTFATHVHVGVPDAEQAITLMNRLRMHLPLLLALSTNSPFWQGRDARLASSRIPIFDAFPRVGIPREFESYGHYVEAVDGLIQAEAIPDPTFLWWDVRPQPRFGTIEVRIMDAQSLPDRAEGLAGLVQVIAHMELCEPSPRQTPLSPEMLEENRFLASRDGIAARLIDPLTGRRSDASASSAGCSVVCSRTHRNSAPRTRSVPSQRSLVMGAMCGSGEWQPNLGSPVCSRR